MPAVMRVGFAGLLLACGAAIGCGQKDAPTTLTAVTPDYARGIWEFARVGPSACVPDTLYVRLTTAFFLPGHTDRLEVSGDWTSNGDARLRGFTGYVAVGGAFQFQLTLSEGIRGTMDLHGGATGNAYCGNGSTAPVSGVRKLPTGT